jgi:hypothetical protein
MSIIKVRQTLVELPPGQEDQVKLLKGIVLGGALLTAGQALAEDDTVTEIRLLKAKLKQLKQRVESQGQKESEMRAKLASIKDPIATQLPASVFDPCPSGKYCYKGITLTPGGWVSRERTGRSRPACNIPTPSDLLSRGWEALRGPTTTSS